MHTHAINNDEAHMFYIHLLMLIQAHLHTECKIWSTFPFESTSKVTCRKKKYITRKIKMKNITHKIL